MITIILFPELHMCCYCGLTITEWKNSFPVIFSALGINFQKFTIFPLRFLTTCCRVILWTNFQSLNSFYLRQIVCVCVCVSVGGCVCGGGGGSVAENAYHKNNNNNNTNRAHRGPISSPIKFTSGWLSWGIITLSWILIRGGLSKTTQ